MPGGLSVLTAGVGGAASGSGRAEGRGAAPHPANDGSAPFHPLLGRILLP